MATDTEELVLSISADTAQIKRAMDRLTADSKRTATNIQQNFEGIAAAKPFDKIAVGYTRSMGQIEAANQNLRFQIADIAQGLSSGASPLAILNQQAGQVTQALAGAGGVVGALKMLGSAVVSPLGLITIGFSAAAAISTAFFKDTTKDAEEASKALDEHRTAIKNALDAWKGAPPQEMVAYFDQLTAIQDAEKRAAGVAAQIADAYKPVAKVFQDIFAQPENVSTRLQLSGVDAKTADDIQAAVTALDTAIKEHKATVADVDKVYDLLKATGVGAASTIADQMKNFLGPAVANVSGIVDKLTQSLQRARDEATKPFDQPPLGQLGAPTSEGGQFRFPATDLSQWNDQALEAGTSAAKGFEEGWRAEINRYYTGGTPINEALGKMNESFGERLLAMLKAAPGGGMTIFSGARSWEHQNRLWQAELAKRGGDVATARQWVAPPTGVLGSKGSQHEAGTAADLKFQSDAVEQWAHQNAAAYGLVFRMSHEGWHIELADQEKVRSSRAKTFDQLMAETQAATTAREKENAINADSSASSDEKTLALNREAAAAEQAKTAEKLLNEAKAEGKEITPALVEQINALAKAYADAGLKSKDIAVQSQQSQQQRLEQLKQQQELADQINSVGRNVLGGIVSDLRAGASAADILNNALNRVLDSLIDMSLNALFSGKGSIGNILAGALGGGFPAAPAGLFHSGGMVGESNVPHRMVRASMFAGARRYAGGGIAGLKPGEVAAILHRGELVIPKGGLRRADAMGAAGDVTLNGGVNIDMSRTGAVAASSDDAREFGKNVQKLIQLEMVRESRPGGLLRRVPV